MEPENQASLVTQLCCRQRRSLELYQAAWWWRAPDRHQVVSVDENVGVTHSCGSVPHCGSKPLV